MPFDTDARLYHADSEITSDNILNPLLYKAMTFRGFSVQVSAQSLAAEVASFIEQEPS